MIACVRAALVFLVAAVPVVACPNCKESLSGREADAWFISIIGMLLAPIVLGGSAVAYIAFCGRKGRPTDGR